MPGKPLGLALLAMLLLSTFPWWSSALRTNQINVALLRHLPTANGGALPTCQEKAGYSIPEGVVGRAALSAAREAVIVGDCAAAMTLLGSKSDPQSTRLRAEILLATSHYAETRDALLSVSSRQVASLWLGNVGIIQGTRDADYSTAVQTLGLAHALAPLTESASQAYATSLQQSGQLDKAVSVMREAVANQPTDAAAHDSLAAALWQAHPGDLEALHEAERAVELRDYFPYRGRLGSFYRALGRLREAEAQWLQVLQAGVARFDAFIQLGDISAAQGRDDEAVYYYSQALTLLEREDVRASLSRACEHLKVRGSARPEVCQ